MRMETFSLALLNLREGMQQEGCLLCQCSVRAEAGFLRSLDWENIYEVGARIRLMQSLGVCGRHAQQILRGEVAYWEVPLGNAILYEGLVKATSLRLRKMSSLAEKESRRGWAGRLLTRLVGRREGTKRLGQPIATREACRVCEVGQESARRHAETLLEMLAHQEYQELYERSEGVCLPHLRLLSQITQPGSGLRYLLEQSARRLESLEADLSEYIRKQSYQYHDEPMDESVRTALARALAYFGGSEAVRSASIDQEYGEVSIGEPSVHKDR